MDRRDPMALSGSTPYYMQREMAGSVSGSGPVRGFLANPGDQFHTHIGSSSIGSALQVDASFTISPHGVNVGAPAAAMAPAEPLRRKRGRPRKYGHDGVVSLGLSPSSSTRRTKLTPIHKRGRGRPLGSGRRQQLASLGPWLSGSAGMGFTPHVITIDVGEDIMTRIMSFSQQGPRSICILSANGAISTVTLCQPSTSGGAVTFEGRFEILRLSGSFMHTDNSGPSGRTGSLSISLSSPDGQVIGGGVGGVLIAASPVQVIVGSFMCSSLKMKNRIVDAGDSERQAVKIQ